MKCCIKHIVGIALIIGIVWMIKCKNNDCKCKDKLSSMLDSTKKCGSSLKKNASEFARDVAKDAGELATDCKKDLTDMADDIVNGFSGNCCSEN